ncbi:MAG: FIST C-terminal domain-containing protein [Planctomycetaceae bacterium]|nr:FIST C-terminal domain-containing protein [Planctomycetaceae bacterium]
MRFRTVHAQCQTGDAAKNARAAVRNIRNGLSGFSPKFIVFFAATDYDPHVLAVEMHDAFPDAMTIGCTTAGEGVDGLILNASVVAMAYSADVFDYCQTALVLGDGQKPEGRDQFTDVADAVAHLARGTGMEPMQLDYRSFVGFMLGDAITPFTEAIVKKVADMTDAIFVGGFAGDDYKFTGEKYIIYGRKAYRSAMLLCLWKPKDGFSLLKTQAVDLTDTSMIITKADEEKSIIWELDNQPAAKMYAQAINTPQETMGILDFDENPPALTVDGEPFVQAVLQQVDGVGLKMYTPAVQGTRLTLTRAGDVFAVTRETLTDKLREIGGASAILHVNCASRHTSLKNQGTLQDFGQLFGAVPSVSFFSYGEIYVGIVTLTSTMILFK